MSLSWTRVRGAGLLAGAGHALDELRHVPDLEIGRRLARLEIGRAVLEAERSFPQHDRARAHVPCEHIQPRTRRGAQRGTLLESDGGRIRVVDVPPVGTVPVPIL